MKFITEESTDCIKETSCSGFFPEQPLCFLAGGSGIQLVLVKLLALHKQWTRAGSNGGCAGSLQTLQHPSVLGLNRGKPPQGVRDAASPAAGTDLLLDTIYPFPIPPQPS